MSKYSFKSVIFDMDGVITKTALVHAQAWKQAFDEYLHLREKRDNEPFKEFTHEEDYLSYVDGKPRYEGVKSFLESRNIDIPFGDPADEPDKETVCGLGNKKNKLFSDVLNKEGPKVYKPAVRFIRTLKQAGIHVGVASSSKNCQLILQTAGIEDLLETRVDGVVSSELNLKGKPEPDIFVAAAKNLGATPADSVVIEDASSGVLAGRNGGFGLVIGIARKNNEIKLITNGADIVVKDLAEINISWIERWFRRKPKSLINYWDIQEERPEATVIDQRIKKPIMLNHCYSHSAKKCIFNGKRLVFFLDYDGTLTPIVERPELAIISEEMRDLVKQLSKKHTVSIVSGRMREDVQNLVKIDDLFYAGSHGFDIAGKDFSMVEPHVKGFLPLIEKVTQELKKTIGNIKGVLVEEKKFSVAAHYRLVDNTEVYLIEKAVNEIIKDNSNLRILSGKKVFEILPDIDWDKGRAIRWIMQALKVNWQEASIIYIGDDTTDEFAFRAIRTRGTGILVSDVTKISTALFQLPSVEEVKNFFKTIISSS